MRKKYISLVTISPLCLLPTPIYFYISLSLRRAQKQISLGLLLNANHYGAILVSVKIHLYSTKLAREITNAWYGKKTTKANISIMLRGGMRNFLSFFSLFFCPLRGKERHALYFYAFNICIPFAPEWRKLIFHAL